MLRHSRILFVLSALCLLLFQGWLAKYHAMGFAELAPGEYAKALNSVVVDADPDSLTLAPHEKRLWTSASWIPKSLDSKLYQLSSARRGAVSTGGNTLIDAKTPFNSAEDFMAYIPRALQVGLLSPMPEFWGGQGSTPAMTMARKIVGVVTAVFYVCQVGLFTALFLFRKNPDFWATLIFCLLGILVYTFTYPNVGTLMRYRYGFYMLLISFGAALIAEKGLAWRGNVRRHE